MEVTKLYLSRSDYTKKLYGSITVRGSSGEITVNLDDDKGKELINCVADLLVKVATEKANLIKEEIIEQTKPLEIESKI